MKSNLQKVWISHGRVFLNGRNMFVLKLFRFQALFECCTFLVCYSNGLYKMAVICLFTIQKWNAIKFKCFCYSGGSKYWPFEYRKHLNNKLFAVRISNGSLFKWSLLNTGLVHKRTRWRPFVRYSNGWTVQYSKGIKKPDHLASNLFLTIQIPN